MDTDVLPVSATFGKAGIPATTADIKSNGSSLSRGIYKEFKWLEESSAAVNNRETLNDNKLLFLRLPSTHTNHLVHHQNPWQFQHFNHYFRTRQN